MKIKRKKRSGIKIEYNKKLFWVIIFLIAIFIILVYLIAKNKESESEKNLNSECTTDKDCIPATCCHPESCVTIEKVPDCDRVICSMVCSGPLDCGAGSCGCVDGRCTVMSNR